MPSKPADVVTTGTPTAMASRILFCTPAPNDIGQTDTAAAASSCCGSGTVPVTTIRLPSCNCSIRRGGSAPITRNCACGRCCQIIGRMSRAKRKTMSWLGAYRKLPKKAMVSGCTSPTGEGSFVVLVVPFPMTSMRPAAPSPRK